MRAAKVTAGLAESNGKLLLKIHILIPIVQPLLENVDRRSLDNNISIAIIWFLFSLFVSLLSGFLNISGSQHQAPTKDISTPADIALSALETLFCCFMGYISQGLF